MTVSGRMCVCVCVDGWCCVWMGEGGGVVSVLHLTIFSDRICRMILNVFYIETTNTYNCDACLLFEFKERKYQVPFQYAYVTINKV